MKGKRNLLIGLAVGLALGWAMGFVRLPFIERNDSFWVGFLACSALVALLIALLFVWNKNALLIKLVGRNSTEPDSTTAIRSYVLVWILVGVFIIFGGLLSSWMIHRQTAMFEKQTQNQNEKIQEQQELIESVRKSSQVFLMSNVLDKVDDDLKANPGGSLSQATLARIAALSYSFKPYRYFVGGRLSVNKLSPERGQLLLALSMMNIDSSSFNAIKRKAPFSESDLSGADLSGMDFSWADLRGATFNDADLWNAKLLGADLRDANLSGANLERTSLRNANLERADLSWANLNEADMTGAFLDGADLANAKLRKADLRGASLRVTDLSGAFLNEANLKGADLNSADLRRINLSNVDLSQTDLRNTNIAEADLSGADLSDAIVHDENWTEKLKDWRVLGAVEIQRSYKVVVDTSGLSKHHLQKIAR